MANSTHITWLLEGVEAWNERREESPFKPNLSRVNVYEEYKTRGILPSDGDVRLNNINLSGAHLFGIDLSRVLLYDADLSSADLTLANLSRAVLDGADLSGACLAAAQIQHTDLIGANLIGANLSRTNPWEAHLYRLPDNMERLRPQAELPSQGSVMSVGDLLANCRVLRDHYTSDSRIPTNWLEMRQLREEGPVIPEVLFYFRGEPCSCKSWELRPSAKRLNNASKLRNSEGEMLLDLLSRRPEEFSGTTSALEQWVLAQHHGLRTRLLDITRNPLIALFNACEDCSLCDGQNVDSSDANGRLHVFAVPRTMVKPFNSDTISVIANFAKLRRAEQVLLLGAKWEEVGDTNEPLAHGKYLDVMRRLYHFIQQEKPYFDERIDPRHLFEVYVVEPQQLFDRVRAQSGAFLISAFHDRYENDEILKWNEGIPVYDYYRLSVPSDDKRLISEDLRLLNITRESLYPGLDEAAKAVIERFSDNG